MNTWLSHDTHRGLLCAVAHVRLLISTYRAYTHTKSQVATNTSYQYTICTTQFMHSALYELHLYDSCHQQTGTNTWSPIIRHALLQHHLYTHIMRPLQQSAHTVHQLRTRAQQPQSSIATRTIKVVDSTHTSNQTTTQLAISTANAISY